MTFAAAAIACTVAFALGMVAAHERPTWAAKLVRFLRLHKDETP